MYVVWRFVSCTGAVYHGLGLRAGHKHKRNYTHSLNDRVTSGSKHVASSSRHTRAHSTEQRVRER